MGGEANGIREEDGVIKEGISLPRSEGLILVMDTPKGSIAHNVTS